MRHGLISDADASRGGQRLTLDRPLDGAPRVAGPPRRSRVASRWAAVSPLLLLAAYAVQVPTPLRLTVDSIHYLTMADSIAAGHGVPPHPAFPVGLPGIYALLSVAGAGKSAAIAALNVLLVAVTVYCAVRIYRLVFGVDRQTSLLLVCSVLLSYVLIEHAALALSDVPFVAVTSCSLLVLTLAVDERTRRRFVWLSIGIAATIVALTIRSAGAALVPATALAVAEAARGDLPLRRWWRTSSAAAWFGAGVAAVALLGFVLAGSRYFTQAAFAYRQRSVVSLLAGHIRDWGEVALNMSVHRLPPVFDPIFVAAGLVIIGVVVAGLWLERRRVGPVHVFTLAYLALIAMWPYGDPRFWLPLVPLAPAYAFAVLRPVVRRRGARVLVGMYALAFASAGLVALGQDTSITYAGARFPDRYGTAETRARPLLPTYRVAFGQERPRDRRKLNGAELTILCKWEPMARPEPCRRRGPK